MSPIRFEDNHEVDEGAPLLLGPKAPSDSNSSQTPLPIAQISVLLTAWLPESIISYSISLYLNHGQITVRPTRLITAEHQLSACERTPECRR